MISIIGRDGKRFDMKCAFIYSDIMVNISLGNTCNNTKQNSIKNNTNNTI